MPKLSAFRGLRYDPSAVADLGAVLCPPYDVISAADRARLLERDARNAVRVELPLPGDHGADEYDGAADEYATAARLFDAWQAQGVLRRDETPALYIYEQRYDLPGGDAGVARSFFCRLRLEDYGSTAGVRPHERTLSAAKEDRLRLLRAVRANLSPVLLLYEDGSGGAHSARLLDTLMEAPPSATAVGPGGVGQRLWVVDPAHSAAAAELLALAARGPLTIADGHHRYETALRYRSMTTDGGADHVLALLYEAKSGALALLPWHRLVSGVDDPMSVIGRASQSFAVQKVVDPQALSQALAESAARGTIGIWTRAGGAVLTAKVAPDALRLDVDILSGNLRAMIGSTEAELTAAGRLTYVSNAASAIATVDAGGADVAFILRPTPVETVLEVAARGGFMPPKSTFFHPKAATGLVFNRLAE